MEINLSDDMIKVLQQVLANVPCNQLDAVQYGEGDDRITGQDAFELFDQLRTEIRLEETRRSELIRFMNNLVEDDSTSDLDVGADEGAVDAGVLKHLDAWLAKRFWFDSSRQDQARIEIRRFLELLPAEEVRDWFDKGWTEILEAAEEAH